MGTSNVQESPGDRSPPTNVSDVDPVIEEAAPQGGEGNEVAAKEDKALFKLSVRVISVAANEVDALVIVYRIILVSPANTLFDTKDLVRVKPVIL
jgi:hypothetical protein